jgi:hypothetical protein
MLGSETTTFTLDNMGRHLCNTFQEAVESTAEIVGGHDALFDVIVIGGGTFGAAVAQRLFENDSTRARRILVLEAGPFVLPEHVQNTNYLNGGVPDMRTPWESHSALDYKGLLFAIGGRSLSWGGWSPELFEDETKTWPKEVMDDLRATTFPNNERGYFWQSSDLIGVTETNDFIYGPLHLALRKQLHAGLSANPAITGLGFADLPEHPAVRYHDPATQGPINADVLRDCSSSKRRWPFRVKPSQGSFPVTSSAQCRSSPVPLGLPQRRPMVSGRRRMRASGSWLCQRSTCLISSPKRCPITRSA